MGHSATYLVLKSMLKSGRLAMDLSELTKALNWFERQKLITTQESKALLQLANELKINEPHTDK